MTRPAIDGWLGSPELPGYRAGCVVARLDDLPGVDPDHLYFDLLLLDAAGELRDNLSGPCAALTRDRSIDERSRFVRVVAELVRHAPGDGRGLASVGQALSHLRERGVEIERLVLAAQLLDDACGERAVVASLHDLLEALLGAEEATRSMHEVVMALAHGSAADALAPPADLERQIDRLCHAGLAAQLSYIVRTVGKARARRYLREVTDFHMVPTPDLLGV